MHLCRSPRIRDGRAGGPADIFVGRVFRPLLRLQIMSLELSSVRPGRSASFVVFALAALVACSGPAPEQLIASGQARLDRGEINAAAIDARSVLKDHPESAAGRLLLARALMAQGDLAAAEIEMQRAEKFGTPTADLALHLARLWLAQSRPELVLRRFGVASDPPGGAASAAGAGSKRQEAELLTLVAQAQNEMGNADAARALLQRALAREPAHLSALVLQIRLMAEAGDPLAAASQAEALTKAHPGAAEAWQLLGELLARGTGREPVATAAYRKALQLEPTRREAHAGLVLLLLRQRDLAGARVQVSEMRKAAPGLPLVDYLEGLVALLGGDLPLARDRSQHLLKVAEPQPQVLLLAGMVQARLAHPTQAESLLAAAVAAAPTWTLPRRELAALLLQQGRAERVLATLEPVLRARSAAALEQADRVDHGEEADLWLLAGQAQVRLANFRAAEAAFARARKLRPADPVLRTASAKLDIALGRSETGLRELQAVALVDAGGIGADLAMVSTLMQRGERGSALEALAAAAAKKPALPLLPYLRGRIAEEAAAPGTPRKAAARQADRALARIDARRAYEHALRLDPRFRPAVDALAALDLAEGQPDAARRRYESLLKLEPNSASALLAMGELALRSGARVAEVGSWIDRSVRADPRDAINWRAAIDLQRRLGDPAATLSRAQTAHATLPDDGDLMQALADAQQFAGESAQSLATLNRLVKVRPLSGEAQLRLALAHGLNGQMDAARAPLARALELAPDAPGVLRAAIRLALADQQPQRARALAEDVQKRLPRESLGWQLEAEVETALGQGAAAAAAYRTAHERQGSPESAIHLHRSLLATDAAAAAAFVQRRIAAAPDDALFLAHLAEVAVRAGRVAEAEERYRQALEHQPDHVLVLNNLADLLTRRRDPEALVLAQRAVRLQPQLPAVLDTLAAAHAAARQTELAVQVQSRAVELQPREPMLRLRLAQHLVAHGKKDKAVEELRHLAQTLGPSPLRDEAEALLRKVGG